MTRTLYDTGLPFSERLGINLDHIIDRVDINKASLIIIDGGIGEGKTTLAVHLADYINKKRGFKQIVFKDQIALGGEEFTEKLRICYEKKLPVLIYDEAGDFNRRGALTRFNMNLNRTFELYRAFKIIIILCLPLFAVLDQEIFNKRIPQFLIHLRGRTQKQGNFFAYSLYRMFYLKARMDKLIVKPFAYSIVEPNLYGHFLDLPQERGKELDEYSIEGKLKFLETSQINLGGLYTVVDISKRLGLVEESTRKIIRDSKVRGVKKYKRRNYYDSKGLKRIESYYKSLLIVGK